MSQRTGARSEKISNLPLLILIVALGGLLFLLLVQNSRLKARYESNSEILENLSTQLQVALDHNSELRQEKERLEDTLEEYQKRVRDYQDQLYELRQGANISVNGTPLDQRISPSVIAPALKAETYTDIFGRQRVERYVGIPTNLSLEVVPGMGRVLMNTEPPMGEVFQDTAVNAKETAERISGLDIVGHDLIFSIQAPQEVPSVDGPSSGAAMTLLILCVLEGRSLKDGVSLTGTISPEGSIGAIGHPVEKAEAADEAGATKFYLPKGNRYTTVKYNEEIPWGPVVITRPRYERMETKDLIQNRTELTVTLVDDIQELLSDATYKQS